MTTKTKTKHLTVRLEDELRAALDEAAEEYRRPVGSLVRLVLSDWIESQGRVAAQPERWSSARVGNLERQ
jgi:predicted transcriptional regulator